MSNNKLPAMVSMLARHARVFVLALSATTTPLPAFAAASGLDTPAGVTDLPFGIQGVQMMDLTSAGLNISSISSGSSRTPNIFITSADNTNQKLYIGINSNGGAASGDYASIEYLQEGQHWGSLVLQGDGGDVGIGTTNPSALFQIHNPGDNGDGIIISPDRDGDNTISIQSYIDSNVGGGVAGGAGYAGGCCNDLALNPEWGTVSVGGVSANWANKFNVVGNSYFSGNVGIATTNPKYALDVTGNVHVPSGDNFIVGDISDVNTGGAAFSYGGTGYGQLYAINQGVVWQNIILGGGSPGTGNVGIANTNPQTALDVSGGIRAGSAATGAGCSPEGTLGYDYSAHALVYCNQSGVWTSTSCGKPYMQISNCAQYSTNVWMSRCSSVQICSANCGCSSAQYGDGVLYATPGY